MLVAADKIDLCATWFVFCANREGPLNIQSELGVLWVVKPRRIFQVETNEAHQRNAPNRLTHEFTVNHDRRRQREMVENDSTAVG
jgi:hypothetical protein